eukprot:GHVL01032539.1.p1 GENE.GHVL01032539.1~~GHVL01032539.1.p1  ORF type:complete len:569 (+),score=89.53 GHVL01032539.1:160-1866(+)
MGRSGEMTESRNQSRSRRRDVVLKRDSRRERIKRSRSHKSRRRRSHSRSASRKRSPSRRRPKRQNSRSVSSGAGSSTLFKDFEAMFGQPPVPKLKGGFSNAPPPPPGKPPVAGFSMGLTSSLMGGLLPSPQSLDAETVLAAQRTIEEEIRKAKLALEAYIGDSKEEEEKLKKTLSQAQQAAELLETAAKGSDSSDSVALFQQAESIVHSIQSGHLGTEGCLDRRIHVSNVPGTCLDYDLKMFFNAALLRTKNQELDEDAEMPVLAVELNPVAMFAVIELRTVLDACLAIKIDGLVYNGACLRLRRPQEYKAPASGDPVLTLDVTKYNFPCLITTTSRLYVGNLPHEMTDDAVKALIRQFAGETSALMLFKDKVTHISHGFAFFDLAEPALADKCILSLNGFVCGLQKIIRCQRAIFGGIPSMFGQMRDGPIMVTQMPNSITQKVLADTMLSLQVKAGKAVGATPSPVVQLINCVFHEDLLNPKEAEEIKSDIRDEAQKFGTLKSIEIPQPADDHSHVEGVGKVFLHYADVLSARQAQWQLNGRKFNNHAVCAAFFPEDKFLKQKYVLV